MSLIDTTPDMIDPADARMVKTLARFGVTLADMIEHVDETITDESIALGARWYPEAYAFAVSVAAKYGVTVAQVAGVIAAVSPRMGWVRNKTLAERVVAEYPGHAESVPAERVAKSIGGALGANLTIAVRILRGEPVADVLTGVKRRAFYNNIISAGSASTDDVTVDTWMQRVVMSVSPDQGMDLDESLAFLKARGFAGYAAIAHAVRVVARKRGLSPATVQAAYWIVASGSVHGWHHKGHGKTADQYDEE